MKATLAIINQMQADGVIGGQSSSPLTLAPVYEYLAVRGYQASGEYIIIEGWQVQFLPPGDDLGEEALAQAIETQVDDVPTLVMTAEHLIALALQLGRPIDFTVSSNSLKPEFLMLTSSIKYLPVIACLQNGRDSATGSLGTYERLHAQSLGKQTRDAQVSGRAPLFREAHPLGEAPLPQPLDFVHPTASAATS
jgi:hypothetical protein